MQLKLTIRHKNGETLTRTVSGDTAIAVVPGDTVQFPDGFAGGFAPNQPQPGDLTLIVPGADGFRVVLGGLLAALESGTTTLGLGDAQLTSLGELLSTTAPAAGQGGAGEAPLSGSGSTQAAAFIAQPFGSFGGDTGPSLILNEPGQGPGGDAGSLPPPSSPETRSVGFDQSTLPGAAPAGPVGQALVLVQAASGVEDTPVALAIQASVNGNADNLQILVSGLPAGGGLSAGTDLGGGLWSLTPAQLAGLTMTPAPNDDQSLALTVTTIATLGNQQSTASTNLPITILPVLDRLFTPGDDTIDLSTLPDIGQPNPFGGPWAEDGNRTDALDGNDVVTLASSGPNVLAAGVVFHGGGGNDTLTGGIAADRLFGGDGDDLLNGGGGAGADMLEGGAGNDTLQMSFGDTAVFTGSIDGYAFALNGLQVSVTDLVAGRDGADLMNGVPTGSLSIHAQFGGTDFTMQSFGIGVSSIDLPDPGNFLVIGNSQNNVIRITGTGIHYIEGGTGNDSLVGGSNIDYLHGGLGSDTLNGGGGADTILYRSTQEAGDSILNFDGDAAGGQDIIDLDGLFDALGVATGDRAARVQVADTDGGSDGPTWLLSIDADGNQGNGFEVALAIIAAVDPITVNQDIQVGQL